MVLIEIPIRKEIIKLSELKANELGRLYNSIEEGEGNIIGFIGEFLFAEYFGAQIENTFQYDAIYNGKRIDVKSKKTSVYPKGFYFNTVCAKNTGQQCDAYYFTRIKNDFSVGYLCGGMSKAGFFRNAKFYRKGEEDPSSLSRFRFTEDCYNLEIEKCYPMTH